LALDRFAEEKLANMFLAANQSSGFVRPQNKAFQPAEYRNYSCTQSDFSEASHHTN